MGLRSDDFTTRNFTAYTRRTLAHFKGTESWRDARHVVASGACPCLWPKAFPSEIVYLLSFSIVPVVFRDEGNPHVDWRTIDGLYYCLICKPSCRAPAKGNAQRASKKLVVEIAINELHATTALQKPEEHANFSGQVAGTVRRFHRIAPARIESAKSMHFESSAPA